MYIPAAFRVTDPITQQQFMEQHSFATLITVREGEPFASHIPVLLDRSRGECGTLVGHVAKENEHWRLFDGTAVSLAVFQGPHAYVSPSWYSGQSPAVPTWNYAAVHAYGPVTAFDDTQRIAELLNRMIDKYESSFDTPWKDDIPGDLRQKLLESVIGFEMPISRIEAKFKLGQNRIPADQRGAIEGLRQRGNSDIADFMVQHGTTNA